MDAKTVDACAPCFARNASAANHVIKTHAHITPCAPAHSHIPCFMMASIAGRIDSFSINASSSARNVSRSLSNLSCISWRNAARVSSSSTAFCSSSFLFLSRSALRSARLFFFGGGSIIWNATRRRATADSGNSWSSWKRSAGLPYYPKLWSGCVAVIETFKRPLSQRSPVYGAASRLFQGSLVRYRPLARGRSALFLSCKRRRPRSWSAELVTNHAHAAKACRPDNCARAITSSG